MNPKVIKCTVCLGPAKTRDLINRGLVDEVSLRDLQDKTGVNKSSIHRHKQNCLKYELQPIEAPIIGELVEESNPSPLAVQSEPQALVVRNRALDKVDGLREYAYGKVESFDRMARTAEESGNLRVAGDLDQKALDASWRIGSLSGVTKEALTQDNRSVNIFTDGKWTPDELRSVIKALSAPKDQE